MYYLVKGIVATGADVFHPGQSPAAVSTDNDHSNSSDTGANLNLGYPPSLPSSMMLLPMKSWKMKTNPVYIVPILLIPFFFSI